MTARPLRQPTTRPAAHGKCRWCGVSPARSPRLLDMGGALLEIVVLNQLDKPTPPVCYWIQAVAGGYTLTREDGALYHLDTTFGPALADWSCDCPDSNYTVRRVCKHRCALYHALRAVGLLPKSSCEREAFPAAK